MDVDSADDANDEEDKDEGGGSSSADPTTPVASELDAAPEADFSGGNFVTLVGDGNLATAVGAGRLAMMLAASEALSADDNDEADVDEEDVEFRAGTEGIALTGSATVPRPAVPSRVCC